MVILGQVNPPSSSMDSVWIVYENETGKNDWFSPEFFSQRITV